MRSSACMILPSGPIARDLFLGAKRLLVPVDGLRGVVERELRRDRVEPFGNGASSLSPFRSPFA